MIFVSTLNDEWRFHYDTCVISVIMKTSFHLWNDVFTFLTSIDKSKEFGWKKNIETIVWNCVAKYNKWKVMIDGENWKLYSPATVATGQTAVSQSVQIYKVFLKPCLFEPFEGKTQGTADLKPTKYFKKITAHFLLLSLFDDELQKQSNELCLG